MHILNCFLVEASTLSSNNMNITNITCNQLDYSLYGFFLAIIIVDFLLETWVWSSVTAKVIQFFFANSLKPACSLSSKYGVLTTTAFTYFSFLIWLAVGAKGIFRSWGFIFNHWFNLALVLQRSSYARSFFLRPYPPHQMLHDDPSPVAQWGNHYILGYWSIIMHFWMSDIKDIIRRLFVIIPFLDFCRVVLHSPEFFHIVLSEE